MLTAMLNLTVATHYCGGNVAAIKVSISVKPATCGMEDQEKDYPLTSTFLTTHCCDDVLTSYTIDDNYTPSFSVFPELLQNNLQIFSLPDGLTVLSTDILKSFYTNVRPPGAFMSTDVDLSCICVFLI